MWRVVNIVKNRTWGDLVLPGYCQRGLTEVRDFIRTGRSWAHIGGAGRPGNRESAEGAEGVEGQVENVESLVRREVKALRETVPGAKAEGEGEEAYKYTSDHHQYS